MAEENKSFFERRIRPLFLYIGFFSTIIFSIAYLIVIIVMITGLTAAPTIDSFIGFLIANLIAGTCIAISMMIQGQDSAKALPENKKITEQYFKKKGVKLHSIGFYWMIAIIKLVFTKLITVAAMSYIVIDICWKGTGQYTYIMMAVFNLLMFLGFGSLGMVSMFDKYNTRYIPWIERQLENKVEENNIDIIKMDTNGNLEPKIDNNIKGES